MRIFKGILIGLAGLIALLLIVAIFVKKDINLKREITINKPENEVFDYLKYLKNQDNFSKWNKLDPGMKKNYTGTDGTVGFISAWESTNDNVGVGEQEIKKITQCERIDIEIRFKKPFEATNQAYFTTSFVDENATKVSWGFDSKMPYPMNLMNLFMDMEKLVGQDFEEGLANLKVVLEKE